MDSESRKHRERKRHRIERNSGNPRSSSGKRRKSSSTEATSSFAPVLASRVPITIVRPQRSSKCAAYLWALLGVCILILLGGGDHVCAKGFALVLPGVALLLQPPERSLGKWIDFGIIGMLGTMLCAFVPLFYWYEPAWRTSAIGVLGIELPAVLTVQPWISFEAFLSAIAGFSWLYAAGNWKVNFEGRSRIYFAVSCAISLFSTIVIFGNLYDWRYPGSQDLTSFSFFPNRNQTADFIAIGGVFAFGYSMQGLSVKKWSHVVGLVASLLALLALIYAVSLAGIILYFSGIFLWFIFTLRRTAASLFLKIALPVLLLFFSFFISNHETRVSRPTEFISSIAQLESDFRVLIFRDTLKMIQDAPLTGVGPGNFSTIFPQYRNLSQTEHNMLQSESDLSLLATEGGLLVILFLAILIVSYFKKCRASVQGRSGAYRIIALTGVIMFLAHGLFNVSGHCPATAYFAIIVGALALPNVVNRRSKVKPMVWRWIGGVLMFVGFLWMIGGLFYLPTHSTIALNIQQSRAVESRSLQDLDKVSQALDAVIALQPLQWRGYFQRAQIELSRGGDLVKVEQDFRRAQFVEPDLEMIAYEEGLVWLPYDLKRTLAAWRNALNLSVDSRNRLFEAMLRKAYRNDVLMDGMIELSQGYPDFRVQLILYLRGKALSRELGQELLLDPSLGKFTMQQRTSLVTHWLDNGNIDDVEAYVESFSETLDSPWFIFAQLRFKQARLEEAVGIIRSGIAAPQIPTVTMNQSQIDGLKRVFSKSTNDLSKGTVLLRYYLERGEYLEALRIIEVLLQRSTAPPYVYYWRAEILYQLQDYSESWYTFDTYLKQIK
ncbi:MAG: O-antigen ligase family protein [Opitutae bacterium]|nr:O-antigen ligase family protein [Opitutae bacterium]